MIREFIVYIKQNMVNQNRETKLEISYQFQNGFTIQEFY